MDQVILLSLPSVVRSLDNLPKDEGVISKAAEYFLRISENVLKLFDCSTALVQLVSVLTQHAWWDVNFLEGYSKVIDEDGSVQRTFMMATLGDNPSQWA